MSIVQAYTEAYRNYLFDESRTMGRADYIAFPRNEAELVEAVRFAHDNHVPLTAQGARTGLAGGASPQGGHDPQPFAHEPHPRHPPRRGGSLPSARAAGRGADHGA